MDFQGIYRKTGGASQMRAIQEAFERNEELNLADETIDITAVTSVLKQYFRKLPTPLITFDVYDHILETSSKCFLPYILGIV
jgi:Rho-type GTPase-activating protein 1/2